MARGIELATAYVSIAAETSELAKNVADALGNVERKVAPKAGKSIGKAMAKGFEAEAPDMERLEREFEDAQARVVQAAERAATEQEALARKVEIAEAKKAEAVEKYGEKSSQALVAVDRLLLAEQKLESASMKAEAEQKKLNDALTQAEEEFKGAANQADRLEENVSDAGEAAESGASKWDGFGDAVGKALSGDFKGAFDDLVSMASSSADDVADEFDGAGETAGNKFSGKIGKVLAIGGPIVAAAGALGTAMAGAIVDSWDKEKLADKMQASMGLTEGEAKKYQGIAKSVWGQAWGETTGEVNEALEALLTTAPQLKVDSRQLENATTQAMALGEAFEIEIPRAAQVASNALNLGLASNTSEAFDMLAAGLQKVPSTLREEFIDAVDEYGPYMAQLGFTGEEAIGILVSATESGGYGIDKMGDSLKEFSLLAKELTDGGAAGIEWELETLGLNASVLIEDFAVGGERARDATQQVIDALVEMEDPLLKNKILTGMFGTAFEDSGLSADDFATAVAEGTVSLGDFEGKADEVADTLGDNTATKVEVAKRQFALFRAEVGEKVVGALQSAWSWIQQKLGPVFKWFSDNILPPVRAALAQIWDQIQKNILPVFKTVWEWVKDRLGPVFELLKNTIVGAWQRAWDIISWAWGLIGGVFKAISQVLKGDLSGAFNTLKDTVVNAFKGIWNIIKSTWENNIVPLFKGVGNVLQAWFVKPFQDAVTWIGNALSNLRNAFASPINWVIRNVINGGIVRVVNSITSALGLGNKLGNVAEISTRSSGTAGAGAVGAGAAMKFTARARGGYTPPGWTLVGEEGPELVNFRRPGMVYTAGQTESMLQTMRGEDISPYLRPERTYTPAEAQLAIRALKTGSEADLRRAQGSNADDSLLPIGGFSLGSFGSWVSDAWKGATEWVTTIGGKAIKFVRGKLADGVKLALDPLKSLVRQNTRGIYPDIFDGGANKLLNWIRGVDGATKELASFEMAGAGLGVASTSGPSALAGGLYRPTSGGALTSRFGVGRYGSTHAGIDLAVPIGTPIYAVADGQIRNAGWNALAGRSGIGIVMAHSGGIGSYYGHLSSTSVVVGQTVKAGQRIGYSGNTGRSTGPHLHWELSRGGNPQNVFDPLPYLNGKSRLFDNGGWLEPGFTPVVNLTNKPEAVLTNDQWSLVESLVKRGEHAGAGVTVIQHINHALVEPDSKLQSDAAASARALAGMR